METHNLAELYDASPMDWDEVRHRLDAGFDQTPGREGDPGRHTTWLATHEETVMNGPVEVLVGVPGLQRFSALKDLIAVQRPEVVHRPTVGDPERERALLDSACGSRERCRPC